MWAAFLKCGAAAVSFILSLVTRRKDDAAKQAGRNEQVIADQKATADAQAKVDATSYTDNVASRLRDGSF